MKVVNLLIDNTYQHYFIIADEWEVESLTNPDKNTPSKEFAKYLYENYAELKGYGLTHIKDAYMDIFNLNDCPVIARECKLELNKWYYKEYKGDCIRKTLIYLNRYNPIYDYYKGYSVKQTTFADGTTEMCIDDNCTFNYFDIVHIKPCNNPMDVFKEATDKYFNDWFGI